MSLRSLLLNALALAGSSSAQVSFGSAVGVRAGECSGQSCLAADIAGITGNKPTRKPEGGSASGWQCVAKYNPDAKAVSGGGGLGGSSLLGGLFGGRGRLVLDRPGESDWQEEYLGKKKRQLFGGSNRYTGTCKPYILIFAKGTTEIGEMGSTVGPLLRSAMSSKGSNKWSVVGVNYSADIAGDMCVGLPGGMIAKDILEDAARKCPQSKIFTSGYSQGAMVAKIAVAYASPEAKRHVSGIVTFGDPFNGAKIREWNGPIKIFCSSTDAVCTGQFKIGSGHLAYTSNGAVSQAASWLEATASQGKF